MWSTRGRVETSSSPEGKLMRSRDEKEGEEKGKIVSHTKEKAWE